MEKEGDFSVGLSGLAGATRRGLDPAGLASAPTSAKLTRLCAPASRAVVCLALA